ncbi:MAG TPA: hypothetical protein DCY13_24855 [Verrucomicrobiales bacterium]|nr:hypothetical protein [Verrucomicrobiales bacterium]
MRIVAAVLSTTALVAGAFTVPAAGVADGRNIRGGLVIPSESYADQPYIVRTDDGAWLCILTTGAGHEGSSGQHVITLRSTDRGRTWSDRVALEPPDGPEASYAVTLKTPTGRVYAFYNHNTDNLRAVKADNPPYRDGLSRRVDSLGQFVFKFSDDHGRTWSRERHQVPVREMEIDRQNPYGGRVRFFWNVGRPFIHAGAAYVPLHKVGGFGQGFFTRNEGVLLRSTNLLTATDPREVQWETLPEGEHGLRTPPGGGPIAAEQSFAVLSDGSFYCVYRSVDGHPVFTYSRDQGRTWDVPQYQRFADGTLMKHPRAANFVWKCANGKYLYWFHNHGGRSYEDRNPAWLCGGGEADTPAGRVIRWSQPEIVLYDDDPYIRMSYPDLVEEDGAYYLTETQKNIARVHRIDPTLVEGLWAQFTPGIVATNGLVLDWTGSAGSGATELPLPSLPRFVDRDGDRPDYGTKDLRAGFSLELAFRLDELKEGQMLLDNRTPDGRGFCLRTAPRGTVELVLNDGRSEARWDSDPGLLQAGKRHQLTVIVDGGPKIISFVVDGRLCDGGSHRQFGWGRFSPNFRDVNASTMLRVGGSSVKGRMESVRIYNRALRVSEAVGNHRTVAAGD